MLRELWKAGIFINKAVNLDYGTKIVFIFIFNNNYVSSTFNFELSEKKSYKGVGVAGIVVVAVLRNKWKISSCKKGGVANEEDMP